MADRRHLRTPCAGGDRGITVVFFAIGISALLAVAALVLGGSVGYTAARNAQTAADSAALAGTSLLQNHKQDWIITDADDVLEEIESVVVDNGARLVRCDLVFAGYALTGAEAEVARPCDELADLPDDIYQAVAGVRVTVSETRDVPFSAFVDQDEISARATAAATIQPVATGRSPFMACAMATGHPTDLLIESDTDRTGYTTNPDAVGSYYVLWGNHVKDGGRNCGSVSADWRGLVEYSGTYRLGGWWKIENGNSNGVDMTFPPLVAGGNACSLSEEAITSLTVGCELAVPLCIEGKYFVDDDPAHAVAPAVATVKSDFRLRCVKMGIFQISHMGTVDTTTAIEEATYETPCRTAKNNIICGEFIGAAPAAAGRGFAATPDRHEFAVVKLVE
jgi:Putative Flp pilus-assembly TadE/G-like